MTTAAAPQEPDTAPPRATPLRTASLRTRTVLAVLALLTALLIALCFTVQALLGDRLRGQLEDRLQDRASAAAALVGTVSNDDLADRLSAQGVSVVIRSADGASVVAGPTPDELRRGPDAAGLGPLGPGTTAEAAPEAAATTTSPPAAPRATPDGTTTLTTTTISSSVVTSDARLLTLVSNLSDGSTVTLTADSSSVEQTLAQLRWIMVSASAAFLLLAAVALAFVVRRTLAPLESMTDLARDIAGGDRGRRLRPDRPGTEIGRVAAALDEMLDEIEGAERVARDAESRVRAFVSDAAHELRTPVAGMQAAADTLVRSSIGRDERERLASHVVREAGRAARLIDDMLLMARVDRGLELDLQWVDLAAVVAREVERQRIRRPQLELTLQLDSDAPPAPVPVRCDAERLGQVLANLVDNAARMTGGTGPVGLLLEHSADTVRLTVSDRGPGVPVADRMRIFDRLVRLDSARNRTGGRRGGGAGLGLPIARGIARAHGGDIVCVEPEHTARSAYEADGPGAVFVVTLPAAGPPAVTTQLSERSALGHNEF